MGNYYGYKPSTMLPDYAHYERDLNDSIALSALLFGDEGEAGGWVFIDGPYGPLTCHERSPWQEMERRAAERNGLATTERTVYSFTMPTPTKLPDGYRIEREPVGDRGVYFQIYRDGYYWPRREGEAPEPRPYHMVELAFANEFHEDPRISVASSSDKSVELATCICEALAMAIAETQKS